VNIKKEFNMAMPLDRFGELFKDYAKKKSLKKLKQRIGASGAHAPMNGSGKGHGERGMDKMKPSHDRGDHGLNPLAKKK